MPRSLFDLHAGEAFGRYELLAPVAEGGMSRVWAARLTGTRGFQKLVAIKTLISEDSNPALERMLLSEARLASQIQHPNVAQYLDLGERGGVLYVVMEWVDGEALTAVLKGARFAGGIPLSLGVQIVSQACKGLHAAHELRDARGAPLGLVHCDVSPHNLMIASNGAIKLIDFGIAKAERGAPRVSHDKMVAGKLSFMAPEQARGERVDRRADVFSLGIILYLLTTGRHPFGGSSPVEVLQRIVKDAPVIPPCAADPNYPEALERVVMRALAHDREARFQSAADMLCELGTAMPGLPHEPEVGAFVERVCVDSLRERRHLIADALGTTSARGGSAPELTVEAREAPVVVPPTDPNAESAFDPVTLPQSSTNAPAYTEVVRTTTEVRKRRAPLLALALFSACAALGVTLLRTHVSPPERAAPAAALTPLPGSLASPAIGPGSETGQATRDLPKSSASGTPNEPALRTSSAVNSAPPGAKNLKPKRAAPKPSRPQTGVKPATTPRGTKRAKLVEQYGI